MIASVGPEADWELSEGAIYYAREANAEVGLAFIQEYERSLALLFAPGPRTRQTGTRRLIRV